MDTKDELTDLTIKYIDKHAKDDKPFFVFLPYTNTHIPRIPAPEFDGKTGNGPWADILLQTDTYVGSIMESLKNNGIDDKTIVIFTSDNGGDFYEDNSFPGMWRGTYFTGLEGSLRVPFIIRWPGNIPARSESNEILLGADLMVTLAELIPKLEAEWLKVEPDRPFTSTTIEELFIDAYSSEKNLGTILSIAALFALLIAAFGLFGLTLFVARSRTHEIGIKKVFGSSERAIVYSFLRSNFLMVAIAGLLSIPVTLYIMGKWLNNFPYRVDIGWWVFLIAFLIATIVVLLTVSIHSIKASRINPVDAIRYE